LIFPVSCPAQELDFFPVSRALHKSFQIFPVSKCPAQQFDFPQFRAHKILTFPPFQCASQKRSLTFPVSARPTQDLDFPVSRPTKRSLTFPFRAPMIMLRALAKRTSDFPCFFRAPHKTLIFPSVSARLYTRS
jgi:hypothetical protein